MSFVTQLARRPLPWRTRRRGRLLTLATVAPLVLLMTTLAACGSSTPSAATLLKQAQTSFNSAQTFHFQLQTQHPGTAPADGTLYPTAAEGDVQRPDRLKSLVTVSLAGTNVAVDVVAIGTKGWYQNPLTQQYVEADEVASLTKLFDPQTGIGALLTQLQHVSQPSDRSISGTPCWYITGTLPGDKLSGIVVGITPTSTPVNVAACVSKTGSQLDFLSLTGQLLNGDTAQTEHDIYFSQYGESVNIQAPATTGA